MAYTTNTLSYLYGGPVEGSWKLWEYTTTDQLAAILAAGYVTDATSKGMSVGDFVFVANQTPAAPQGFLLQVQSVTAASGNTPGTATLVVPAGVNGPNPALPRNLIDGGDFTTNPFQRGTSFTGITNTLTYTADRWFAVGGASSSISVSQQATTAVPTFSNSLQFGRANGNANTAVISLGQVIESADSVRAQGQQVTLSFWAQAGATWSPANGNLNVQINSGTGTNQSAANMVAGTWTGFQSLTLTPQQGSATAAANIAQPITTTWTRYAFTATVPANCSQLGVQFNATPVGTAGSADFVQIIGVQLEIGPQPTPFEHLDIQMVLEIAQRYFYQLNEPASGVVVTQMAPTGANTQSGVLPLPVQMRTAALTVTVNAGTFKVIVDGAAPAAATGLTGNASHNPNGATLNSTVTLTQAAHSILLTGGGGTGTIAVSADF